MLPPPAVGLMDPLGGDPHPFVHPEKGSSVQTNRPRSHALDGPPAVPATSGSLSPHLCGCSDSMSRSAWRTRLRIAGAKHSNSRASSPAVRPGRTSSTIWRRYEDLVESGGLALFRRLGHTRARPAILKSRNDSGLYDKATIDTLLQALLETGGTWTRFYRPTDCEQVAERLRHGR